MSTERQNNFNNNTGFNAAGSFLAHGGVLKELLVTDETRLKELWEKAVRLPRINLSPRQVYDLEMLLTGGFSPLEGFMDEDNYNSVVEKMRLVDGTIWPIPIVLDVSCDSPFNTGDEIVLCDQFGKPLAIFTISSKYSPDKRREALEVYGTEDRDHPGVKFIFENTRDCYLGGLIEGISRIDTHDFHDLRLTPRQLHEKFQKEGFERVVGFQTRNPLHRAHFELIKRAAVEHDAKVLIHPVVGLTKEGDIDYHTRVRCYRKLHENYARDFAVLSLLPLAMRMAGPREALWHAIIRKNHGCTHFIVGRDHAGPGKNPSGKPFYDPYAAQELALQNEQELGITIVPFQEMVYVDEKKSYLPMGKVELGQTVRNISGTEVRRMLRENEPIPSWFSFPEVVEELRRIAERRKRRGFTIFFTGLSGAGKSTIAQILYGKLLELQDREITFLDGDVVRQHLSRGLGFSLEDRKTNIERIGFVASEIVRHGGIALCAAIAPDAEAREKNRRLIEEYGHYIEAYVATPLEVCRTRDIKGLYRKAEAGLLKNLIGVDQPYEPPENPEIILDTTERTALQCAEEIVEYLKSRGLI